MFRPFAPLAALAVVTFIAGCASRAPFEPAAVPASDLAADWPSRREQLRAVDSFTLAGRVAVVAGDEGFSAGLRWQQRGARGSIVLEGPFGVGALAIDIEGQTLRVTTGRGDRYEGDAARAALEQQLGFELPLDALRYWVRGLPFSLAAEQSLDPAAPRLLQLREQGWQVQYSEYQAAPFDYQPRRLVAGRGDARVRLIIERWGATAGSGAAP
jgi:outer membrane lipoprotein LolB